MNNSKNISGMAKLVINHLKKLPINDPDKPKTLFQSKHSPLIGFGKSEENSKTIEQILITINLICWLLLEVIQSNNHIWRLSLNLAENTAENTYFDWFIEMENDDGVGRPLNTKKDQVSKNVISSLESVIIELHKHDLAIIDTFSIDKGDIKDLSYIAKAMSVLKEPTTGLIPYRLREQQNKAQEIAKAKYEQLIMKNIFSLNKTKKPIKTTTHKI